MTIDTIRVLILYIIYIIIDVAPDNVRVTIYVFLPNRSARKFTFLSKAANTDFIVILLYYSSSIYRLLLIL